MTVGILRYRDYTKFPWLASVGKGPVWLDRRPGYWYLRAVFLFSLLFTSHHCHSWQWHAPSNIPLPYLSTIKLCPHLTYASCRHTSDIGPHWGSLRLSTSLLVAEYRCWIQKKSDSHVPPFMHVGRVGFGNLFQIRISQVFPRSAHWRTSDLGKDPGFFGGTCQLIVVDQKSSCSCVLATWGR